MSKLEFSTEFLPQGLDDRARLARWTDTMRSVMAGFDYSFGNEGPIHIRYTQIELGATTAARFDGSLQTTVRRSRDIAADRRDQIMLTFNRGGAARMSQRGRESVSGGAASLLFGLGLPYEFRAQNGCAWDGLAISRDRLAELIPNPEDLLLENFDPDSEAMRHLRRYVEWLNHPETAINDMALRAHVDRTLLDLVALVLGTGRDTAELAGMRGLRAARLQQIVAEIRSGFIDPAFSVNLVAFKLGVTPRYVQDLLQETGSTFAGRVMELRLQQARAMLGDVRHDRLKVSDIALACGFNEVSYFNRCFRRRFGASPTQYRGGGTDDGGP